MAHVWAVSLELADAQLQEFFNSLSTDEQAQAERFRIERERHQFIAAHGVLRRLLGAYLQIEPRRLWFEHGPYGKPALKDDPALCFNLARSSGLALIAATRGREVGVDVELLRPDLAGLPIAAQFFSPFEVEALRALPEAQRVEGFFNAWTRKAAYVKARGQGLSFALKSFDVSLAPGQPARLLRTRPDPDEARRWSLHALTPAEGFVGALAVAGSVEAVACWAWPENG